MIENSPFHISNKRLNTKNVSKPSDEVKSLSNSNDKSLKNSEPTFWDWFRGLVNPLQNLPIISGIYSSINSDNSESDRDLVQNSLGGFMYGGPIGAIAGFGNWIFNKEVLVRSNLILGEKTQIKKIPNLKTPNEKYRELNFDYPEWKPNDLEISKKSSDKSKYLIFQEKILDEDSKKLGKNLNIKL